MGISTHWLRALRLITGLICPYFLGTRKNTRVQLGDHLLQSLPLSPVEKIPPLVSELTTLKERRALMASFPVQVALQRVFESLGPSEILNYPSSTP